MLRSFYRSIPAPVAMTAEPMAEVAPVELVEIARIETVVEPELPPRVVELAQNREGDVPAEPDVVPTIEEDGSAEASPSRIDADIEIPWDELPTSLIHTDDEAADAPLVPQKHRSLWKRFAICWRRRVIRMWRTMGQLVDKRPPIY